jgi:hypothetical protein
VGVSKGVTQVVEGLPSKCKTLSPNPTANKMKKGGKKKNKKEGGKEGRTNIASS